MFSFSAPELGIILVIALIVFGPGKLPDVGKALGRSIQEFRGATNEINNLPSEMTNLQAKTEESKKA